MVDAILDTSAGQNRDVGELPVFTKQKYIQSYKFKIPFVVLAI